MSPTWRDEDEPAPIRPSGLGWLRLLLRAVPMVLATFGGLLVLLILRLPERAFCGQDRPLTSVLVQWVCRFNLRIMGLKLNIVGTPMTGRGALVANHASWLDIFVLNAADRVFFVSKAEVARWPGIGWLARATGTVFIARDPREAEAQRALFEERLRAGHRLLFFPEGTSTDGMRVLPFKPTLFAAFFADGLADLLAVQPVGVIYHAPPGVDPRFYGWWGDMDFGAHFLQVLAAPRQGRVDVVFGAPIPVRDCSGRKELSRRSEEMVRKAHQSLEPV